MSKPKEPTGSQLEFIKLLVGAYLKEGLVMSDARFVEDLKHLLDEIDPLFAAKSALYIRQNYNLWNIPNYIAVYISKSLSGKKWAKGFYYKMVMHLDDMVEMANIADKFGDGMTKSMRTGFSKAFHKFDSAQLLKYNNNRNKPGISLQDIINMVHPKASGTNAIGMDILMNNAVQLDSISDVGSEELFRKIEGIELA